MYDLEQFLNREKSTSYDGASSFDSFMSELMKVPGYREKFELLVSNDPRWLKAALARVQEEKRFLDYLLCVSKVYFGAVPENELELGLFENQTEPVVKVTTYRKDYRTPPISKFGK